MQFQFVFLIFQPTNWKVDTFLHAAGGLIARYNIIDRYLNYQAMASQANDLSYSPRWRTGGLATGVTFQSRMLVLSVAGTWMVLSE